MMSAKCILLCGCLIVITGCDERTEHVVVKPEIRRSVIIAGMPVQELDYRRTSNETVLQTATQTTDIVVK